MIPLPEIVSYVAGRSFQPIEDLLDLQVRDGRVAMARQTAMWLASYAGWRVANIAEFMGRDEAAVRSAIKHISTLRASSRLLAVDLAALSELVDKREADEAKAIIVKYRRAGATIPTIARWVGRTQRDVASILGSSWEGERQ